MGARRAVNRRLWKSWRDPLQILVVVVLMAWVLGWVFDVGTGLVYTMVLVAALVSVARLPWRQRDRE